VRNILATALSLPFFLIVGFMAYMYYPENQFALQYQQRADCQRRQDLHQVAELLERHFGRTGHYPLTGSTPISTVLTEEALPRQFKVNPPPEITGSLVPAAELKAALEQGLGEEIKLPADPQTAFAWGSRYYLYQLDDNGDYLLTATLFSETPQTFKQARYRYLYRIGSKASAQEKIQHFTGMDKAPPGCD
jgi:hypothetical protein